MSKPLSEFSSADTKVGRFDKEKATYSLARTVLWGGAILLILSGISYICVTDKAVGKDIFDAAKQIVPPIFTLVLGYYFASKHT